MLKKRFLIVRCIPDIQIPEYCYDRCQQYWLLWLFFMGGMSKVLHGSPGVETLVGDVSSHIVCQALTWPQWTAMQMMVCQVILGLRYAKSCMHLVQSYTALNLELITSHGVNHGFSGFCSRPLLCSQQYVQCSFLLCLIGFIWWGSYRGRFSRTSSHVYVSSVLLSIPTRHGGLL